MELKKPKHEILTPLLTIIFMVLLYGTLLHWLWNGWVAAEWDAPSLSWLEAFALVFILPFRRGISGTHQIANAIKEWKDEWKRRG